MGSSKGSNRWLPLLRLVFHAGTLAWYTKVWAWHLTDAGSRLPGANSFGWYFKFLTFWSFTLQLVTLAAGALANVAELYLGSADLALAPALAPKQRRGASGAVHAGAAAVSAAADDLACVAFGLAHVVTIMFHAIQAAGGGVVEGSDSLRPLWLNPSMHIFNSAVAWVELLACGRRSFSGRARVGCCLVAVGYTSFIVVCRQMNGRFPYPFLNNMPMPSGFIGIVCVSVSVLVVFFEIGRLIHRVASRDVTFTHSSNVVTSMSKAK